MTEIVLLSTASKIAWKNSNRFKIYDNFSQYAKKLKYEKLDVTINSFQSHNAISCDVLKCNRFKQKHLKFCCFCSIMMITILMSILMKAFFFYIYTYNLEKMHFKCLNLKLKIFCNRLNLNTWTFWFEISFKHEHFFLTLQKILVQITRSGPSNLNFKNLFKFYLNLQCKRLKYAILNIILLKNVF